MTSFSIYYPHCIFLEKIFARVKDNNNNNNNNKLQLGCHPVAVVILQVYKI